MCHYWLFIHASNELIRASNILTKAASEFE